MADRHRSAPAGVLAGRPRIAYIKVTISTPDGGNRASAIETIAADGTDPRRLVYYSGPGNFKKLTFPIRVDFAPDGARLAVVESRNNVGRIAIVDAQSGDRKRLQARVTGSVGDAVWSPDGRRIAYVNAYSNRVFTIRPDGTGKRLAFTVRLSSPGWIDSLAWQPRP